MATDREQVQTLIEIGLMPADAERIVVDVAERNGQTLTGDQAAILAHINKFDEDAVRLWWYYSPAVPERIARILDAQPIT